MSNVEFKVVWENDILKKFMVVVFKDILISKGISIIGKKVDLLERFE